MGQLVMGMLLGIAQKGTRAGPAALVARLVETTSENLICLSWLHKHDLYSFAGARGSVGLTS